MTTATIGLSIEEFEQLPNVLAHKHELVDGELVDVSGNTAGHILLRDALLFLLYAYVRQHQLGLVMSEQEFDFDRNAHGPDISFMGPSKVELLDLQLRVQRFVPDLAIEIASKNDGFDALFAKALRYRRCGTKEVWIFSILTRQVFLYSEGATVILGVDDNFQ